MAWINDFATEGSPRWFTCSGAAEGHHLRRPLTRSAQLGTVLLSWLLVFWVGGGRLWAGENGAVTGTVAGLSQVPIPGAKVTLAAADGSRQSVTTDQHGHYSFPSVEPATYLLSAEATGYAAATRPEVRVTGGTSITVDLLLAATGAPAPNQAPPVTQPPSYYDDTPLKAGAVISTTDAAGYSSQAQSPGRLLHEGPSLTGPAAQTGLQKPGSPEAAATERELCEALRVDPNRFETNHQLGECFLSVGDGKSAIPYLEKAQELKAGDYPNGYDLAEAYLETKSLAKAQILLGDLIRRQDTAEVHHLRGEVEEALGDPSTAVKEFQLAAQKDPSEKNVFDWGNELLLHESVEPAREVFQRGVALYPHSPRMYIGLGIALYSRSSYDGAIEALCHASDLDPSDPRPYLFLGQMYNVSAGQADEVAKRMNRFMETNPGNAFAYYYGALSAWKGSRTGDRGVDLARVEALFRKSLALDPRLADAHLQLGILYHDQHRDREAIAEYQIAIRLHPDDPDAHYRLAQAYVRTGDQQRGQEEMQLYDKLRQQREDEAEKRRREVQ